MKRMICTVAALAMVMLTYSPARAASVRIVTTTADVGPGSLREAIDQAVDDDIIRFDPALAGATIAVESPLVIDQSIAIDGPPPFGIRVSGGNNTRVFSVEGFVNANIQYLTILEGNVLNDGDPEDNDGGGIRITGEALLNLAYSSVIVSTAARGGGIFVGPSSHVNIHNSTIGGNQATIDGGGIASEGFGSHGSVRLTNSTVTRNTAHSGGGGGIWIEDDLVLTYSTVAFNNAYDGAGGIHLADAWVQMRYSIVSNNTFASITTANCSEFYGVFIEAETNLSNDTSCDRFVTLVADPMLATIAGNGGPTATHALPYGSPALDVIPADNDWCTTASIITDQRGVVRPQHQRCDLGAFERIPAPGEVLDELISLSAATPGMSNGTQSKLLDARDKLFKGQLKPACNKLKDYIEDVQNQRGKKLAPADADALIALATELRTLLGC
jgi:hypothetical protein